MPRISTTSLMNHSLTLGALQRGKLETGGAILDDAQIEEWWFRVYRKVPGEEPRTEILLYSLED